MARVTSNPGKPLKASKHTTKGNTKGAYGTLRQKK